MSNIKGTANGQSYANFNWDEVPTELPPITPGIYRAQSEDAEAKESKTSGNMTVHHKILLLHKYGENTPVNRRLTDYVPMGVPFRIKQAMQATGCPPPSDSFLDGATSWAFDLKAAGANGFWVLVGDEADIKTGEPRPRVKRYLTAEQVEKAASRTSPSDPLPAPTAPANGRRRREVSA